MPSLADQQQHEQERGAGSGERGACQAGRQCVNSADMAVVAAVAAVAADAANGAKTAISIPHT